MALIALILLAMGLRDVNFEPSQPLGFEKRQATDAGTGFLPPIFSLSIWMQALILIGFLGLLVFGWFVLSPAMRKRMLFVALSLSAFLLIFYFTNDNYQAPNVTPTPSNPPTPQPQVVPLELTPQSSQPPPAFQTPQFSSLVVSLVSFAAGLLLVFLAWRLNRWRSSRPLRETLDSLAGIGEAARLALDDLAAGIDQADSILRCYERMNAVVCQKRELTRHESKTASEFAALLVERGLPAEAVRRLTCLFESVRYGARGERPLEIKEARDCLTTIARFCGVTI